MMQTQVLTEEQEFTATATLFGDQYARLVQLGPYRLECYLDGILCVFTHRDEPGLIGFVGTIFGTHQVNIAAMTVGRTGTTPGGDAIGVLNLDNMPSQEALEAVRNHPAVRSMEVVKLPRSGQLPAWLG